MGTTRAATDLSAGEFIELAARDQAVAWEWLFRACHTAARATAETMRDRQHENDAAQTILLRCADASFRRIALRPSSSSVNAYLMVIARNEYRRVGRASARERRRWREPPPVRCDLETLTPVQRMVMQRIQAGATERELAAELGWTRDRVHDVRRRAVAHATQLRSPLGWAEWCAAALHETPMSDGCRALVQLVATTGSVAKAAGEIGLSSEAVRSRLRRIRESVQSSS